MERKGRRLAVWLVVSAPGAAVASAGPDRGDVRRALEAMTASGAAGAQARVVADGRESTARSGVARLGSTRPVPVGGWFRIAGVTKTFTATVALQLVAEGRLSLDDAVAAHLPGLLPDGEAITVRMLLAHTSGLRDYSADVVGDLLRDWELRDLVALSTAHPLDFAPGTARKYSNTGYVVAGLVVERVTGRSWAREVRERVVGPLRLRGTTLPRHRTSIPGPHAHGYAVRDGRPVDVTAMNPSAGWAAGEIVSTTADLDTVTEALVDGRLLPPAQLAGMTAQDLGLSGSTVSCGVRVWGHSGDVPGFHTLVASTRDGGTRLVLSLTSAATPLPQRGYRELVEAVFCP